LPLMPFISGHEGRHRNRAMAGGGEKAGLVTLFPRTELREGFPRKTQEEYIEALKKELEMTGNLVLPQYNRYNPTDVQRPAIKLPDIYAEGGGVHMVDGGKIGKGIVGALTKASNAAETAMAARKAPQEDALRLAQQRAALPPTKGGLGLPADNTPQQRAAEMKRNTDAYHGSRQDITGAFRPGYDDNLAFVTKSPEFANKWIGKGKMQKRVGDQAKQELKSAEDMYRDMKSKHMDYDNLSELKGDKFHSEYDRRNAIFKAEAEREFGLQGMPDKIHSTVYPLTVESNKIFNPETDMDVMAEFFAKNNTPQEIIKHFEQGNYLVYETKPVVNFLKSKGYDSMRLRESTGDDYPTIAVFNPESIRGKFAAHDPFRKDVATAIAMGVLAPDLMAEENKKAKGGAVGQESPEDIAQFNKLLAMHKAIGGMVKKFDDGGAAFGIYPKAKGGEDLRSGGEYAGEFAKALGKLTKDQSSEEVSSLKKPRAATDLLNRGVLANNPLSAMVDLVNMGLVPLDVLGSKLTGRDIKVSSDKPFLGSEYVKDLMNKYNVTSGEERPMMETALSFASPAGMIKGALKAPELTKKTVDAVAATGRAGAKALGPTAVRMGEDYLKRRGLMPELDVYHGSPHKFDRFDASKIGTGEGSQAYGHGLYTAESPTTATSYRAMAVNPGRRQFGLTGEGLEQVTHDAIIKLNAKQLADGDVLKLAEIIKRKPEAFSNPEGLLKRIGEYEGNNPPSFMYKVDLPDKQIAKMLDWDRPLSEQPDVIKALKGTDYEVGVSQKEAERIADMRLSQEADEWAEMTGGDPVDYSNNVDWEKYVDGVRKESGSIDSNITGKDLHRMVMRDEGYRPELFDSENYQVGTSETLRSMGIPGIKYLDATSRGGGKGTRNFVTFPGEEQSMTILERNGQPLKARGGLTLMR